MESAVSIGMRSAWEGEIKFIDGVWRFQEALFRIKLVLVTAGVLVLGCARSRVLLTVSEDRRLGGRRKLFLMSLIIKN
ncbi:hypothetical protein Bca101_002642 [Brassica carinata]